MILDFARTGASIWRFTPETAMLLTKAADMRGGRFGVEFQPQHALSVGAQNSAVVRPVTGLDISMWKAEAVAVAG